MSDGYHFICVDDDEPDAVLNKILIFMQHRPVRQLFGDTDDMRRCVDFRCDACGHTWTQPSRTGRCPACHDARVVQLEHRYCTLPRS